MNGPFIPEEQLNNMIRCEIARNLQKGPIAPTIGNNINPATLLAASQLNTKNGYLDNLHLY